LLHPQFKRFYAAGPIIEKIFFLGIPIVEMTANGLSRQYWKRLLSSQILRVTRAYTLSESLRNTELDSSVSFDLPATPTSNEDEPTLVELTICSQTPDKRTSFSMQVAWGNRGDRHRRGITSVFEPTRDAQVFFKRVGASFDAFSEFLALQFTDK
jgi:hypothetical protein